MCVCGGGGGGGGYSFWCVGGWGGGEVTEIFMKLAAPQKITSAFHFQVIWLGYFEPLYTQEIKICYQLHLRYIQLSLT